MADLTSDAYLRIWGEATIEEWALDTSTAQTIYKGQPMILDINVDTVNLRGYVDATVVAADDIFIGIAAEGVSVESGATEGETKVKVYVQPTIVGFPGAVFTDADVGDPVRMSDSSTLSATVGDNPEIGKLTRVEGGFQYVRLLSPYITSGA